MINQYAISKRLQDGGALKSLLASGRNKNKKRKVIYCAVAEGIISDSEVSHFAERGAEAHPAAVYRLSLSLCGQSLLKAAKYLTRIVYQK